MLSYDTTTTTTDNDDDSQQQHQQQYLWKDNQSQEYSSPLPPYFLMEDETKMSLTTTTTTTSNNNHQNHYHHHLSIRSQLLPHGGMPPSHLHTDARLLHTRRGLVDDSDEMSELTRRVAEHAGHSWEGWAYGAWLEEHLWATSRMTFGTLPDRYCSHHRHHHHHHPHPVRYSRGLQQ
jgi:hypothetical protein